MDENFLNSSLADFVNPLAMRRGRENSVRGWLLLENLAQWRAWNADKSHPLYGKVDMDRIALIGHSRGGDAVDVANAFNGLDRDPDDATIPFDFHFKIKAIAAIAPIDGQYQPRARPAPRRDQGGAQAPPFSLGRHQVSCETEVLQMALAMTSSFLATAVRTSRLGLPVSRSRCAKALSWGWVR